MNVRPATAGDADVGSLALRRSISELCHADHNGDPAIIMAWTANKTPDHWYVWLAQPGSSLLVAEREGQLLGVGMVDRGGTIMLNYVVPEARYAGVSTALLKAMEEISVRHGLVACTLESTRTAERFYAARGYVRADEGRSATLIKRLA